LIIQWKDYQYWGRGRYDSLAPVFETMKTFDLSYVPLTGSHRPDGILIAHGSGIQVDQSLGNPRLIDIAPTVLQLLGIPVPGEMDGDPIVDLFQPDLAAEIGRSITKDFNRPSSPDFTFSPDEAETIADRLKSLGYL
jgi:hypothetical protein